MAYLIHFNKNHSSKDGRFVSGDGDGDGVTNDYSHRRKDDEKNKKSSGGGGGIILDEDDTGEDEEQEEPGTGITSKYTLKELIERQNKKKDKKKKKSKSGSRKKKKKSIKVRPKKIAEVIDMVTDAKVTSDDESVPNAEEIDKLLDDNDDTDLYYITKLLGK